MKEFNGIENSGLSKEAREKLAELIIRYDPINNRTLRSNGSHDNQQNKSRLPIPGTVITRIYKEKLIEVKVLEKGFEYQDKHYRSLTGITKKITGSKWNGFNFFNL